MGGTYSGMRVSVHVLVSAALTVALFAAARYIPVLGLLVSLLTPTPILLLALRYGLVIGLLALGFSSLSLTVVFGSLQSALFVTEYGVMALAMAEALRREWPVERTILVSTALPSVASGILLVWLFSSTDLSAVKLQFEEHLSQGLGQLWIEESAPKSDALHMYIQDAFRAALQLLPALFILSTAAGALLNYGVVRFLWRRLGGQLPHPTASFTQWKAPDVCVWVLIASGLCATAPLPSMQIIGLNVLLLVSVVYLVQGLGIMVFYLNRASVPSIFRSLVYLVLVIQPLFLLGVAACGLFDLWFDFRRIGDKREETQ
jgi:uncharacterized protein YybS (DUF2232 family)